MPPRRSRRKGAKPTAKKSTRISKRKALQSAEEEIEEQEVKIKQEGITENDGLEQSAEQLKGDNVEKLDDKSWVVAFDNWELDGVLDENLFVINNEDGDQRSVGKATPAAAGSVGKATPAAADEVVKSPEHMDGLEDVEDTAVINVLKSPACMDNYSRVQEGGDKEGKSGVKDDQYNEDNHVIQLPGHLNDFYGVQEGGDGEGVRADERDGANNVKDDECSKGKPFMKSPGHLDDFSGVPEGGDEEGNRADNMEDDEDNNVIKSCAHVDDFSGVEEGGDGEGKSACKMESIDGVKDNVGNEVNNVLKSPGHADEFVGVHDDGDEELKSGEDMEENGDGEASKVTESLRHLDDCSIQESGNEEGTSACERESIDGVKDDECNEVNNDMKSPGHAGEFIGVQDGDNEELKSADDMEDNSDAESADDMEDNGDNKDNKVVESLGHLDDSTKIQEGCDEGEDGADDVEDNEDSDDTEEVEDPSLTNPGKRRQLEIHVTTVHVKGLVKSWNAEKLKKLCKQYGEIVNVRLPRNFGARRKDFGFIVFTSHKSALACVEGINNTHLGGETKVKADLAKSRFRDTVQRKKRWDKHQAKSREFETKVKEQTHGDKSKLTGKGREIAKEESQAPSLLNSTKVGKQNNHRASFHDGQDTDPVKTDRKIKSLPQKVNDRGKRKIDHDLNNRRSKKSRGNARGRQWNRNSVSKLHHKEGNSSFSGSKRRHSDMEPHAGYIEPATRKPARHYAGYAETAHGHQGQCHTTYLQHPFPYQSQPSERYVQPGLGRQSLTYAGYIEPNAEKQSFAAYDYSLRRASGYSGQGSQGSAYVRGSAVPPSYAQSYTSDIVYQSVASVSSYYNNSGTYLPQQRYY